MPAHPAVHHGQVLACRSTDLVLVYEVECDQVNGHENQAECHLVCQDVRTVPRSDWGNVHSDDRSEALADVMRDELLGGLEGRVLDGHLPAPILGASMMHDRVLEALRVEVLVLQISLQQALPHLLQSRHLVRRSLAPVL